MTRKTNGDAGSEGLKLDLRKGLPDALRVLVADYPRAGWESDPGFDGLIRFWLDRHMMFRRILDRLQSQTKDVLGARLDPALFRQHTARLGSTFVQELHGHHSIEDMHYFPVLAGKDARIARAFDLLDADHHALDAHLNAFVEHANAALEASDAERAPIERFHTHLDGLGRMLNRHLLDEEEIVVPVILKYGAKDLG